MQGEFFLQRLRTPSAESNSPPPELFCPASEPLRRAIFGNTSSIFDLWSRPWGVAQLLGLREVSPRHYPSKGSGSTTTATFYPQNETTCTLKLKNT